MDTSQAIAIQTRFLGKIDDVLAPNTSLVHELSEVLEISADSAYRRMRGDTALTIYEVVKLCEHFKVSFESVDNSETGVVTFGYTKIGNDKEGFKDFLVYLKERLHIIEQADNKYIKYACEDIPVFYNYKYPELAAFKMFYWMKSIMNVTDYDQEKFSLSSVPEEYAQIGEQIAKSYCNVPSVEIWTETTILSTIKQIEFYLEAGQFNSNDDFLQVCEALRKEIEDIQKQADTESKLTIEKTEEGTVKKNYTLYYSDIEITNNCVLISIGDVKSVFLGHQTFNTIDTNNLTYCVDTENWMDSIIRKSTLISGVSEKQRFQFFNKMYKAIDNLIAKVQG